MITSEKIFNPRNIFTQVKDLFDGRSHLYGLMVDHTCMVHNKWMKVEICSLA